MKKLLAFVLVCGMTSLGGAALQLSVNGDFHPVDSEIVVGPSHTIVLDIWSDIPISPVGEGEGMWALTCVTADGAISVGTIELDDPDWVFIIEGGAIWGGVTGLPDGEDGIFGGIFTFGKDIPKDTAIYDNIEFHAEWAPNDVVVSLWQLDAYQQVIDVWDRVTVHIPEPASMALLGLGGLLLLRRRK